MAESEVSVWLKSISHGLDLQRLAPLFESRGFKTRSSLAYLEKNDLEVIINSPAKLLLAEKRIIEKELQLIKQPSLQPKELFPMATQPLQVNHNILTVGVAGKPTGSQSAEPTACSSFQSAGTDRSDSGYLQRKSVELTENLTLLKTQSASAKQQLQFVKNDYDQCCSQNNGRKGKLCANCHQSGHYKGKCCNPPCISYKKCNAADKHPEAKNEVLELQKLVKDLEKREKKASDELDSFKLAKERAMNSFFAAMRPRLRRQNEGRYVDRFQLDKDLMILKRILNNKVPLTEDGDWEFPHKIEQYKRSVLH